MNVNVLHISIRTPTPRLPAGRVRDAADRYREMSPDRTDAALPAPRGLV